MAISAACLLTRRRSVTGVTQFLQSIGVTCGTVVEKRRKKRIKKLRKSDASVAIPPTSYRGLSGSLGPRDPCSWSAGSQTLANALSINAQMLEKVVRKPASTDLRGIPRQRQRLHQVPESSIVCGKTK